MTSFELKVTPLDRVQIIEGTPPAQPGKCVLCGTSSTGTYIDIGWEIDYYGVIYYCEDCMQQVANSVGFYSVAQVEKITEFVKSLEEENANLKAEIEKLQELKNVVASLTGVDFGSYDGVSHSVSVLTTEPEISSDSDEGEEGSDEQVDEQRFSDVQHNDTLDELFDTTDI